MALIGLYANLSSAIFSNMGNWIANHTSLSNYMIIFCLNITGFMASLFIQSSVSLNYAFLQNQAGLVIAIIILRAGLTSFVNLSLLEIEKSGISAVLGSLMFFYVANITNLVGNFVVGLISSKLALGILSAVILVSITGIHLK